MSILRDIHRVIEYLASGLGITLNSLLFYMIVTCKVPGMKQYNIILLQTCSLDFLLLFAHAIGGPMVAEAEGVQFAINNGIFRQSSIQVRFLLWDFWATCNFLTMTGISVEFVYRYLLLCHNRTISLKLYLLLFGGAVIGAMAFGLNGWMGYYLAGKNDTVKAESSLGWILADDNEKVGAAGAIAHGTLQCYIAVFVAVLLSFGSYSIIAYCTWKIYAFMKKNEYKFSKSVRKVNRDLNKMLFVQAACPIISYVLPIGIFAIGLFFPAVPMGIPGFICSLALSWGPVGNAASILLLVTAYRRKLISLITCNPTIYSNKIYSQNTRSTNYNASHNNSQLEGRA